jgi:hypothetical protein
MLDVNPPSLFSNWYTLSTQWSWLMNSKQNPMWTCLKRVHIVKVRVASFPSNAVQASGGIQPQPSRFGPDEISAAAAIARFTCQYGSRNGSRPLTVRIINVATTICTSSSCSCIICSNFLLHGPSCDLTSWLKKKTRFNELRWVLSKPNLLIISWWRWSRTFFQLTSLPTV